MLRSVTNYDVRLISFTTDTKLQRMLNILAVTLQVEEGSPATFYSKKQAAQKSQWTLFHSFA